MQPCAAPMACSSTQMGIMSCADEKNELWRISPDKSIEVILNKYNGKLLNAQMIYGWRPTEVSILQILITKEQWGPRRNASG